VVEEKLQQLIKQRVLASNRTNHAVRALVGFIFIQLWTYTLAWIIWQVGLAFPDEENCNRLGCEPHGFVPILVGVVVIFGILAASGVGWYELDLSQVPGTALWPGSSKVPEINSKESSSSPPISDQSSKEIDVTESDGVKETGYERIVRYGMLIYFLSWSVWFLVEISAQVSDSGFESVLTWSWLVSLFIVVVSLFAWSLLATKAFGTAFFYSVMLAILTLSDLSQIVPLQDVFTFSFRFETYLFGSEGWEAYFNYLRLWPLVALILLVFGMPARDRALKA
jgi:hypothetical protein